MAKLAINGGEKVRTELFPQQNIPSKEARMAVEDVMRSGRLTGYQANMKNNFGGHWVRKLEERIGADFNSKYPIAMNSCTSALHAACAAINLQPGDEVIVTPFSMTCSATIPMHFGATPVFADIEHDMFCLDPIDIYKKITKNTKAIIVVDLFGQPYDVERINAIAKDYGLYVIEDAAQAIGSVQQDEALYPMQHAGTFGDIGCFSFNHGKNVSAGEGGMCLTDNEMLARRIRGFMNHAESVNNDLFDKEGYFYSDRKQVGLNLRMTELSAAVAVHAHEDYIKHGLVVRRGHVAKLQEGICSLPMFEPAPVRPGYTHSYYVLPLLYNDFKAKGVHRDVFLNAVRAELPVVLGRESEGVPIGGGYIKPIYRMPAFDIRWDMAPVCEELWKNRLVILHRFFGPAATTQDLNDIITAFHKVAENLDELK